MIQKKHRSFHQSISLLLILSLLLACKAVTGGYKVDTPAPPASEAQTAVVEASAIPEVTETPEPLPTEQSTPTEAPPAEQTWLVMLYQDAEDEPLEEGTYYDLNEAETVSSSDRVTIISQIDRYKGGYTGDGNWTGTRRYALTQDADLESLHSQLVEDLGELDSGDPQTLVDFATWAIQSYPANRYVLVLSDHGSGWPGGLSDDDPNADSRMTTNQIDEALAQIIRQTRIGQFELVGFDACLMSGVESLSALAPYAHYAVGSEETEPSLGFAYAVPLAALAANPDMNGADLARSFVQAYIAHDLRVTDDSARRKFLLELGASTSYTAQELAASYTDITQSAIDLTVLKDLDAAVNDLAVALTDVDQSSVAQARSYAQSYTNVFGEKMPPSYIDLGHFASLLEESLGGDAGLAQAVKGVQNAIHQAVIAEKHGSDRPGSTGVSIYFPNSTLFRKTSGSSAEVNYTGWASRFAAASLWDDFLQFHYKGTAVDPASADLAVLNPVQGAQPQVGGLVTPVPVGGEVVAPGAGQITIDPITLSDSAISSSQKVTLSTRVSGNNIGYMYIYILYYDKDSDSYVTADVDFITADNTKVINGVYYPDWGGESFPLDFEWQPTEYYLNNGKDEVFAVFEPEIYGKSSTDTTYLVYGTYTYAESGEKRSASIRFNGDGKMVSVWAYRDSQGASAPSQVTPRPGDQFTVLEEWLEFTNNPQGEFVYYDGGTLTFGDRPFEMVSYTASAGKYILSIAAEDADGNNTYQYAELNVTD